MVYGEVVGLMNGELVMAGILEGDCKDRIEVINLLVLSTKEFTEL